MSKERIKWYLRQLLPLHYRTRYTDAEGKRHFVVWQMWLGRSFAIDDVVVDALETVRDSAPRRPLDWAF